MNIFILDTDIEKSVQYHYDTHVRKILLEMAQVLCTVQRLHGNTNEILYKATHINHPIVKWVNSCINNYQYTYLYFLYLGREYQYRFNKVHKSYKLFKDILGVYPDMVGMNETSFYSNYPCVMDDIYKIHFKPQSLEDVIDNYRNYYNTGKKHLLKYTLREKPYWLKENV